MKDLKLENKAWIDETWSKIEKKLAVVSKRTAGKIPYTTIDGKYDNKAENNAAWWTNGFWAGILWHMYSATKDESYKTLAEEQETLLDEVLYNPEATHHDVGFQWSLASVAGYKLTGSEASKRRGLIAAKYLMSRYNPKAQFIVSWNSKEKENWSIIDTMMNLPLLYWASEETEYLRYKDLAMIHADQSARYHVRPDGSVNHINVYDYETGELVDTLGGQGYIAGSSWSRGQSWALYGFALSYNHTKEQRYLDIAKKVAHYFIANVATTDYVPLVDFRSPDEPKLIDTTAGAIAACGLIEIARNVPEFEKKMYLNAAVNILMAMEKTTCDWTTDCDAILLNGTEAYAKGRHISIIYGDFYFIEAILKLKDMDVMFW